MDSLVIVIQRAAFLGTSVGYMFSIQGSQGMMVLPSLTEQICYHCPFLECGRTSNHSLLIFLDDGCAHLVDNAADSVMNYLEAKHQGLIAVSCRQKRQHDGQPQTSVLCLPVEDTCLADCWSNSLDIAGSTLTKFLKAAGSSTSSSLISLSYCPYSVCLIHHLLLLHALLLWFSAMAIWFCVPSMSSWTRWLAIWNRSSIYIVGPELAEEEWTMKMNPNKLFLYPPGPHVIQPIKTS